METTTTAPAHIEGGAAVAGSGSGSGSGSVAQVAQVAQVAARIQDSFDSVKRALTAWKDDSQMHRQLVDLWTSDRGQTYSKDAVDQGHKDEKYRQLIEIIQRGQALGARFFFTADLGNTLPPIYQTNIVRFTVTGVEVDGDGCGVILRGRGQYYDDQTDSYKFCENPGPVHPCSIGVHIPKRQNL